MHVTSLLSRSDTCVSWIIFTKYEYEFPVNYFLLRMTNGKTVRWLSMINVFQSLTMRYSLVGRPWNHVNHLWSFKTRTQFANATQSNFILVNVAKQTTLELCINCETKNFQISSINLASRSARYLSRDFNTPKNQLTISPIKCMNWNLTQWAHSSLYSSNLYPINRLARKTISSHFFNHVAPLSWCCLSSIKVILRCN